MDFQQHDGDHAHWLFAEPFADRLHEHVFTTSYWQVRGSLGKPLGGRGSAWRIREDGIDWVLRHYLRGGAVRHLVRDWYFYTGLQRTRPFAEFHLLNVLYEQDLPVPRPVAARVLRGLLGYRGSLVTETLPGESLASLWQQESVSDEQWRAVGRVIRRLHDAGAWHADLNASNILLDREKVSVIDWDRGRIRFQDTAWREANLARLQRSLRKLRGEEDEQAELPGWQQLRAGYD